MLNQPQKKVYSRSPVVKNNVGVNFVYLRSTVTSAGGGTYITRALDARNKTGADVIVFMIPNSVNALRNIERIKRGREDLMSAVKPLILPFKIVAVISENQKALEEHFEDMLWSDVKY
ncbi:gp60 [Erwinia phage vB_EamM-Y2]|uniref:Gp60 n=1 Tax=Erwinia phage vB_EamM-Y2 TaxID=1051676 RepID=G0YQ09_9CAUD|nr:gp60 [Erwinia phage vB_EamM-Y2]AEJ81436.1 gp60 [Erwinia phage vB_EamM-Y2]